MHLHQKCKKYTTQKNNTKIQNVNEPNSNNNNEKCLESVYRWQQQEELTTNDALIIYL